MSSNIPNHADTETIIKESFETAEEFVAALSPMNDRWGPNTSEWIFRGQGDASLKLIPTALRSDPAPVWRVRGKLHVGLWPTNREQAIAEFEVIRLLAHSLDDQGISFPGKDPVLRTRDSRQFRPWQRFDDELFQYPLEQYLSLFALAQHHGIPTRLLDWSESAWTAAYFAAAHWRGADVQDKSEKELSVWALQRSFLLQWEHVQKCEVELVTAPWATTPNLCAQKGFFTVYRPIVQRDDPPRVEPLDDLIKALAKEVPHWSNGDSPMPPMPLMYQLKLPVSQAKRLLRLLYFHGASGVTLFPGYDGAARMVFEMQAWE